LNRPATAIRQLLGLASLKNKIFKYALQATGITPWQKQFKAAVHMAKSFP
jgi:hypothetical protein